MTEKTQTTPAESRAREEAAKTTKSFESWWSQSGRHFHPATELKVIAAEAFSVGMMMGTLRAKKQ